VKKKMNEESKKIVEEIKSSLLDTVTPAVTEKVFDRLMDELPNRKDLFGNGNSADTEVKKQKEDAAAAIKSLAHGEVKALTTGGSTSGAEFVPTYVSSEIVRIAENVGLVRRYARKWPMQGSKENVPTADAVTAYRVTEGSKITSSQPGTGSVSLSSKTVGVLIPFSRKLLQNATPQVVDVLNALAAEALAKLEDKWALVGLSAGEGVLGHASVPGVTMATGDVTYAKATAEHLLDMIDKVDDSISEERLRWVLSRSVFNALRKQRAAVGSDKQGFLFQGFGNSTPPTMWDIQYSLSPVMPKTSEGSQNNKKFMALVDFGSIIHGDEQKYSLEISEQATITDTDGSTLINLFEQNMVAVKVSGEIDIQLANAAKAFATLKTANS
jgi:HK97 family phage major capsid protein